MGAYAIVVALCYATFAGVVWGIHEQPSTYNLLGVVIYLVGGIAILLRWRWGYALLVMFSAFAVGYQVYAFSYWASNQGDTESLQRPFFVLTIIGVAIPLLLLRSDSRRWFVSGMERESE